MTDDELADVLADFDDDELDDLDDEDDDEATRARIGWARLVAKLTAKGHSKDAAERIAHHVAVRKYGKAGLKALQAEGRAKAKRKAAMRSGTLGGDFYDRVWTLDDIEIIRGGQGGDGRTVSAYAAIYGSPTEIRDQHGHYMEIIDRAAFRRTLAHGDISKRVTVLYNHGLGLNGEHHPLGSVPIGSPIEIRSDDRGLLTVTRFNKSELADAVLEAIKAGDIRGYSFRGRVFRSDPERVPRIQRGGPLPIITRTELGLSEYGPTPIPFYADAAVVAIRSSAIAQAMRLPERERIVIARALLADEPEPETTGEEPETPTSDTEVEPDEGTPAPDATAPTTPDDQPEPGPDVEDPEDASPTDSHESPGTEDPPEEALLPVSQAARSLSAADVARKARVALILRGKAN